MTEQSKWAEAFVAAQGEFPAIEKTQTANAGSFTYKYADLADIIAAVRPVLASHGLAVTQDVQIADGLVHVTTVIWHASGESRSFGPLSLPSGSTAQQAGSAITYARRYAEAAALNIAAEVDDDGKAAAQAAPYQPGRPIGAKVQDNPLPDGPFATKEQQSAITDYFAAFEQDLEEALKRAGVKSVSNLTETTAAKWIDRFKELESEKAPA